MAKYKVYDDTPDGIKSQLERDLTHYFEGATSNFKKVSTHKEKTGEITCLGEMMQWLEDNTPKKVWFYGRGLISTADTKKGVLVHVLWDVDDVGFHRKERIDWREMWVNRPAKKENKMDTCKRKGCEEPREGSQFCREHTCTVKGCNNGPKKDEVLCGPHSDQANAMYMEQAIEDEKQVKKSETVKEIEKEGRLPRVAYTGHRPPKLAKDKKYDLSGPVWEGVEDYIDRTNQKLIDKFGGFVAVTGGALGVDQQAARDAHRKEQEFELWAPCYNQEKKWPAKAQEKYRKMRQHASDVFFTHKGDYPGAWVMQKRNEQMVDNSDYLIAVWDGSLGGTHNCVKYALEQGKKVHCYNPNTREEGWNLAHEQMLALHNN